MFNKMNLATKKFMFTMTTLWILSMSLIILDAGTKGVFISSRKGWLLLILLFVLLQIIILIISNLLEVSFKVYEYVIVFMNAVVFGFVLLHVIGVFDIVGFISMS